MVIQRENNLFTTTQDECLHKLTNADEAGHAGQPVLVLHIGSHSERMVCSIDGVLLQLDPKRVIHDELPLSYSLSLLRAGAVG